MNNWDDFRFVVALARYGSMARAAKHLRMNPATVSRHIKRLNETSGTAIFHKGQNDWELTTEGTRLFEIAADFHDRLREFSSTQSTDNDAEITVRISTIDFIASEVLTHSISDFCKQHPNIRLEISASDDLVSLAYGEADLAVRMQRPDEGRLVAKRIGEIDMGVFGQPGHMSTNWIGLPTDLDWTPEMANGLSHFKCPPRLRLPGFHSIRSAILRTGLPGIGPEFMFAGEPGLVALQDKDDMALREVWLVFHETRKHDRVLRSVSNWIEQTFAAAFTD